MWWFSLRSWPCFLGDWRIWWPQCTRQNHWYAEKEEGKDYAFLFRPFTPWTVKAHSGASVKLEASLCVWFGAQPFGQNFKVLSLQMLSTATPAEPSMNFLNIYRFWNKQLGYRNNHSHFWSTHLATIYTVRCSRKYLTNSQQTEFQPATYLIVKKVNGVIIEFQRKCF